MHMPDGFIDAPTSAGAAVVAVAGVGVSLKKASETLQEKQVPLCGLVAAFIFAVPDAELPGRGGTSGHLLGGVLAAVLVGPWAAVLCVSVVLSVQALLFADGGLSALGLNVVNMAMVTAFGGYAALPAGPPLLPRTQSGVVVASGFAAACRSCSRRSPSPSSTPSAASARARSPPCRRDGRCAHAHRHR